MTDAAPEGRDVVERPACPIHGLDPVKARFHYQRGYYWGCTVGGINEDDTGWTCAHVDLGAATKADHDADLADVAPAGSEQGDSEGSATSPAASLPADSAIHALAKGVAQATIERYRELRRLGHHPDDIYASRGRIAEWLADTTMACADEDPESEVHALRAVRPPVETRELVKDRYAGHGEVQERKHWCGRRPLGDDPHGEVIGSVVIGDRKGSPPWVASYVTDEAKAVEAANDLPASDARFTVHTVARLRAPTETQGEDAEWGVRVKEDSGLYAIVVSLDGYDVTHVSFGLEEHAREISDKLRARLRAAPSSEALIRNLRGDIALLSAAVGVYDVSEDAHRAIVGALKSTIHEHGPITREHMSGAAKRIVGQLKTVRQNLPDRLRTAPVVEASRVLNDAMEREVVVFALDAFRDDDDFQRVKSALATLRSLMGGDRG